MHGTYDTIDGRPALCFERRLSHPVDAVWRAVTEPSELEHWFPTDVEVDLRVGGRMRFTFREEVELGGEPVPQTTEGEVLELDPPRHFAFDWDDDRLHFELEPDEGGNACLLRFTVVLGDEDKAARDAAGWHVCLDVMERRLAGEDTAGPDSEPNEPWRGLYEDYQRRGLPARAPLPD